MSLNKHTIGSVALETPGPYFCLNLWESHLILWESTDSQLKKRKNKSKVHKICWYSEYSGWGYFKCQLCVLFDKQSNYWDIIKKDNFIKCLELQNEAIPLTIKGFQKEACWFSTRIDFDSHKCDIARLMAQIDSVILVKSEILRQPPWILRKYCHISIFFTLKLQYEKHELFTAPIKSPPNKP